MPTLVKRPTRLNAQEIVRIVGGKGLVIPEQGWNSRTFIRYGTGMIVALNRLAKITQRKATPILAAKAKAMFANQVDEVIRRVLSWSRVRNRSARPGLKAEFDIPQNAELWVEAMNEVFAEAGIDAVTTIMPSIQSTMAQGYSKTSIVMGQDPAEDIGRFVTSRSREIAQRITQVSQTTRDRIMNVVRDSIDSGLTVTETAAAIESAAPMIYGNRSLTIARTELNRAWTQGAVASFQESETLTHLSVIGCEAREPNSPQYNGESTCNIQDVPVADADMLDFHPNHTGNLVPSRFRNPDGTQDLDGNRPAMLDDEPEGEPPDDDTDDL